MLGAVADEGGEDVEPYDWECEDPDDCRHRWMFLWVLIAVGMVGLGLALGFAIDWLQGRIL